MLTKELFTFTDDWSTLSGNVAKLGLGLFSVLFDVIFSIQHFILYRYVRYMSYFAISNKVDYLHIFYVSEMIAVITKTVMPKRALFNEL